MKSVRWRLQMRGEMTNQRNLPLNGFVGKDPNLRTRLNVSYSSIFKCNFRKSAEMGIKSTPFTNMTDKVAE